MRLANLPEYSVDWQHLACLLYALDEMGGENTRYETTEFIRAQHYLQLQPIDYTSYQTQTEERWRTDIAFARKIGVISGDISFNGHNAWGITRSGREAIRALASNGDALQVHRCFLWSTEFKRLFVPTYRPSTHEPRPKAWTRVVTPDRPLFEAADWLLKMDGVQAMLTSMSAKLGFRVTQNRVSLALALRELRDRTRPT